jgi:hypothetical protein
MEFAARLAAAPDWGALVPELVDHYARQGSGVFARYRAFRWVGPPGGALASPAGGRTELVPAAEDAAAARWLAPVPAPDAVQPGELIGYESERALLARMGLQAEYPDSGCCGMAGSFGYEPGRRYQVSQACGERVILPAVRRAAPDTLIIADGFSCREQIAQATGRRPVHLAQVLKLAAAGIPDGPRPEDLCWESRPASAALLAAAGVAVGATPSGVLLGRFFKKAA